MIIYYEENGQDVPVLLDDHLTILVEHALLNLNTIPIGRGGIDIELAADENESKGNVSRGNVHENADLRGKKIRNAQRTKNLQPEWQHQIKEHTAIGWTTIE